MTTDQRTTLVSTISRVVGDRLSLRRWFRLNAAARHGVPWDEDSNVNVTVEHVGLPPAQATEHKAATQSAEQVVATITPAPAADKSSLPGWVKPAVIAGASVLAGVGGTAAYNWWNSETTVIERPLEQSGSLLQDLEDRGFHLSEGRAVTEAMEALMRKHITNGRDQFTRDAEVTAELCALNTRLVFVTGQARTDTDEKTKAQIKTVMDKVFEKVE